MATQGSTAAAVLSELIQFLRTREHDYQQAATDTSNALLGDLYRELAGQQATLVQALQPAADALGPNAAEPSANVNYFQTWREMKTGYTASDEQAIVEYNIRGEEWLYKAYADLLEYDLPESLRETIGSQQETAAQTLARLNGMRAD